MKLSLEQRACSWGVRRVARLTGIEHEPGRSHEIVFDLLGETSLSAPVTMDGFVMGVIFYAMRMGEDIQVEGALSHDALLNLREFQEAWQAWRPGIYRRVAISAATILRNAGGAAPRAISAFSGGMDSSFTLLRHRERLLGDGSYPLDSVMMVHGFDIPLAQSGTFDTLVARVRPLLDRLGVRLRIVRTNLKSLDLQDWEDSHIAQLAACLHNFSAEFGYGLVGSGDPYSDFMIPYGSNPITDRLLSGGGMRLVHDGAGFGRTEKAALLSRFPLARSALKVCWEGEDGAKNCGVCEKCICTQLNFLAAGSTQPECFDRAFDQNLIRTIGILGEAQCRELMSIKRFAETRGIQGRWLTLLRRRLAANCRKTPRDAFWYAQFKLLRGLKKLRRVG